MTSTLPTWQIIIGVIAIISFILVFLRWWYNLHQPNYNIGGIPD